MVNNPLGLTLRWPVPGDAVESLETGSRPKSRIAIVMGEMKMQTTKKHPIPALGAATLTAALLAPSAFGQTCPEPKPEDFKVNTLVSTGLKNPVHLAVAPDGRVFIADMNTGEIRLYKPGTATTTVAGKVPTRFDNEDGLLGIALHPALRAERLPVRLLRHHRMTNRAHVLFRYKVNGDAVDIASGVEVLRVPRVKDGRYHAGGGMAWDSQRT